MKYKQLTLRAVLTVLAIWVGREVHAGIITGDINATGDWSGTVIKLGSYTMVENLNSFNLSFVGTAVEITTPATPGDDQATATIKIGTDWIANLVITFVDQKIYDQVSITGKIQHINPPLDGASHFVADSFDVRLLLDAERGFKADPKSKDIDHLPHHDHYTQRIGGIASDFDITQWDATITGAHVPEPSSFALLGLGGIGLMIGAYRHRRTIAA